jgi:hypothetical protein
MIDTTVSSTTDNRPERLSESHEAVVVHDKNDSVADVGQQTPTMMDVSIAASSVTVEAVIYSNTAVTNVAQFIDVTQTLASDVTDESATAGTTKHVSSTMDYQITELVCSELIWESIELAIKDRRSTSIASLKVDTARSKAALPSPLSAGIKMATFPRGSQLSVDGSSNNSIAKPRSRTSLSLNPPSRPQSQISPSSPDPPAPGVEIQRRQSDELSVRSARAWSIAHSPATSAFRRSWRRREKEDERIVVGTKISEGHANYVLMYDMLTGIRIAVSRCVSKPHRELLPSDFRARHKLTFDIMGNELTPSSLYDFKFKDYAPWAFRGIREHFKIEAADYLVRIDTLQNHIHTKPLDISHWKICTF